MGKVVAIGVQDFEKLISEQCFYIDKTRFIREWWESQDEVTLITRPRRFGKTLNMSMLERFFGLKYNSQGEIFAGLDIWKEEKYQRLQGTYPVISLSFAGVKEDNYEGVIKQIYLIITNLYSQYSFLLDSDKLTEKDRAYFGRIGKEMDSSDASVALSRMSEFLLIIMRDQVE